MAVNPGGVLPTDLFDTTYVVLDFETTGLSPAKGSEVIETGAVRMEGGRETGAFEELSRPVSPIPAGATRVHGITDEMVAGCSHFSLALPGLLEFLGDATLVAHNAPFDRAFLDAAVRHLGLPTLTNPVLDTVRLSRRLFPELERHDLNTLCTVHRIDRGRGHRALDDARATSVLLRILLERASESGVAGVAELMQLGGAPRRGAPGGAPPEPVGIDAGQQAHLEEAIVTGGRLEISYVSVRGVRSRRHIVPYQIDGSGANPRLVAFDLDKEATRTFRLDRITRVDREESGE